MGMTSSRRAETELQEIRANAESILDYIHELEAKIEDLEKNISDLESVINEGQY